MATQDKPCTYIPLLVKPTPTNLEWSLLFFSLSLLSMYGNQFANRQALTQLLAHSTHIAIAAAAAVGNDIFPFERCEA